MSFPTIRRIVTGHDENGKAVVSSQGPLPTVVEIAAVPGSCSTRYGPPLALRQQSMPPTRASGASGGKSTKRTRVPDLGGSKRSGMSVGLMPLSEKSKDAFRKIGDVAALTVKADSPHPLMHRTETVDYGIVIEGEITLVLDDSEVSLGPGSVVVQRGTNHAWANRSGRPCRMLFVLVDGTYEPAVAATLAGR
jgi:mannose-6-phosphate isomerase-like protein (cupin superfamily)